MKVLMLSLDKQTLESSSRAADRMKKYGQDSEIFIIVPSREKKILDLSPSVHVESVAGGKISQFFRLYNLGKKLIQNNQIEMITAQDPFFTGLLGTMLKRQSGIPLEIQLHGDFYSNDYYKNSGLGNWLRYWLGRFVVLPRADKVRVVGERIRRSLIGLGVKEDKIFKKPVVHEVSPRYTNGLRGQYSGYEKIFVWTGRMVPVKNLFFLVDIFGIFLKKRPHCLLLLVGEGSQRVGLENKVKQMGLEKNVKFVGWVDNPSIYLANADAVLFPSLSEGYGLVVMEAVAAGTPVIMTDVGVANYELKPGPKVKIVPVNDKDAFVKAMLEI